MARPCVGLAHAVIGEAPENYTEAGLAAVTGLVERAVAACCQAGLTPWPSCPSSQAQGAGSGV